MPVSNRFVSRFVHWTEKMGYPPRIRARLPSALRKLPSWLAAQDRHQHVVIRTIEGNHLNVNARSDVCWIYPSEKGLVLGAVGPGWNSVRKLCGDEEVEDLIDHFVFFVGQYAVRSRLAVVVAGAALVYGATFDFREADIRRITVGPQSPFPTVDAAIHAELISLPPNGRSSGRRSREVAAWVGCLNPAEPILHRALFQYWRACSVWNAGFGEETITALDGVAAVAGDAVKTLGGHALVGGRVDVARWLGMCAQDGAQLERLYQIRCAFGAHPPVSKWWDFSEIYADHIDDFFCVVRNVIVKLAGLEARHRRIELRPSLWSTWFVQHADLLFDAVWFDRLP